MHVGKTFSRGCLDAEMEEQGYCKRAGKHLPNEFVKQAKCCKTDLCNGPDSDGGMNVVANMAAILVNICLLFMFVY